MAWQKGQSGNPAGRVKGAPTRTGKLRKQLEGRASDLIETAINLAIGGDVPALKLCLERILPALRPRDLPEPIGIDTTGTLPEQGTAILAAMSSGQISIPDAAALLSALSAQCRLLETAELEQRISILEQQQE